MTSQHEVVTRRDQLAVSGPVFREFTGKLADMEFPIENNRAKSKLQFTEMHVIEAVAHYPHPTGEIIMNRTGRNGGRPSDRSPWGRLLISADNQGYPDMLELLSRTLHMKASEEIIEADPENNRAAGSFLVWDILAVDGADNRQAPGDSAPPVVPPADPKASSASDGAVTEEDLISIIDGKTIGEFVATVLPMTIPAPLRARMLNTHDLIPAWLAEGKVTTDGNIYTKV